MKSVKSRPVRNDEWKRLREQLLQRIVENEAKRRAGQAVVAK